MHSRHKFAATIATKGIIVTAKDDCTDFGDVVGLRRLYKAAVDRIRSYLMHETSRAAILVGVRVGLRGLGGTADP